MTEQTDYSAAVRECLESGDIALMRKLWKHIAPHLPQPRNDEEALITLHMARTASTTVDTKKRMYSHCWLKERSYPSQLPDPMRASAERMYPIVVKAVGTSINASSALFREVLVPVRAAVREAILEIHADGKIDDSTLVKRRILEAKQATVRKLLGVK
jgi:hypothetical protein